MGTRKKGSELIFNLQWRNKPDNGGDKSNVIGMYDTPTTTSSFEMFKSYLLKNSGVAGNDVKVTYLTDNGQEWVIDSQDWFEIALSAFRLKARLGEVIFLKLDKISNGRHAMSRKHSNDVETQFDIQSVDNNVVTPPEWFVTYMKQFKKDIVEEVTYAVSSNAVPSNAAPSNLPGNSKERENILLVKKNKPESSKRSRKQLVLGETPIDKEFIKTLKFDRKLENKLDKLDAKTKKIKEKKQALINKIENDDHRCLGKFSFIPADIDLKTSSIFVKQPVQEENNETATNGPTIGTVLDIDDAEISSDVDRTPLLNAFLVNAASINQTFTGGEVYLQTWEVINSGNLPWSSNTDLRLTWGSADLVPSVKSLRCPSLKPGEQGSISVRFEIPETPGTYESNWNFYDNNVRFGRTLSLYVTVLPPIRYINSKVDTSEGSADIHKSKMPSELPRTAPDAPLEKGQCKVKTEEEIKVLPIGESTFCLYFPNGIDGSKAFNIPINWDKKIECTIPKTDEVKQEMPKNETPPEKEELKTINATLPINARRIYFYPNGIEDEKCVEISLKKSAEKAVSLLKINNAQNDNEVVSVRPLNEQNSQFVSCGKTVPVNNENTMELSQNQNSPQHSVEDFYVVGDTNQTAKENASDLSTTVVNLTRKIENMNLAEASNADSDSDWESVGSYGKSKRGEENLTIDYATGASNKYGISENELIVDLSMTAKTIESTKVVDNKEKDQTTITSNKNDDDNNNNGTLHSNNSSGESISEIASEVSSDSSGYVHLPVFEEEKEESSGYVYITIDGNKLPVPRHILRPDFLASFEQASGSINSDEQKAVHTEVEAEKNATDQDVPVQKLESPAVEINQDIPEQNIPDKSLATHCSASATGSCFSDTNSGRLFIFPQHHPGYEFVAATNPPDVKGEEITPVGGCQFYNWMQSETQYNIADLEAACGINPALLRCDPYGPLEHSHLTAEHPPISAPIPAPVPAPVPAPDQPIFEHVFSPTYACAPGSTPEEYATQWHFEHCPQPPFELFQHVPNYQQCAHNHSRRSTVKSPSAPPQQPKTPVNSPSHSVPVHILPENFVNGAVNVASSAINTARSVINMIVPPRPEPGRWDHGHWVTENPESLRAKNLCILAEMGFWDADLNATLLARYKDDIARVVSELVQ